MRSIQDWLAAVLRDVAGTPAATAGVRVATVDPARPDEHGALVPDVRTWITPDGPRTLLVIGRNITSLDAGSPAAAAVEIASHLQDAVMDELSRPWPEVSTTGGSTVLEPRLGPDGTPQWAGRGIVCGIGRLGVDARVLPPPRA